jgi:hypothetical protein
MKNVFLLSLDHAVKDTIAVLDAKTSVVVKNIAIVEAYKHDLFLAGVWRAAR